jgi:hypothetical protein
VDYRPDKRPKVPPDSLSSEFHVEQARQLRYVIMQAAAVGDSEASRLASDRARDDLEGVADRVACDGRWCLYRVRA